MNWAEDRTEEYLLVREIRSLVKRCDVSRSVKTQADYTRKYERMARTGFLPEHARTRQTFYAYRAALIYATLEQAKDALRRRDRAAFGSSEWSQAVADLEQTRQVLRRYPPDPERQHCETGAPCFTWSTVSQGSTDKPRTLSKRRTLSYLSRTPDWRARLFAEIPSHYMPAVSILALTGARPSEIARGVEVSQEDGNLLVRILGSKVTHRSGQPERRLLVSADSVEGRHMLALAESGPVTIRANAQALCAAIERAGMRAFPNSQQFVSPYVFRHALASQLKAEGRSPETIGACLGHIASDSCSAYGRSVFGGSPSGILSVSATHAVRSTHRSPTAALHPTYALAPRPAF